MSALLLFDQINIQRALANGTSLDDITTSGTDPTAPFSPRWLNLTVYFFWLTSLILSLATAFFAILVDGCYCHYVSPIPGQPKLHARTRHLRYKGLIKSRLRTWISFLQLLLHLSLISFVLGLALINCDQSVILFNVLSNIYFPIFNIYVVYSVRALKGPENPWKTPITYILSAIRKRPPITTVPGLSSSLEVKNLSEVDNMQASEICAAHESRIENEVDALHWLYERSSTSAIHRLVIQALAGLSPDHKACADEAFSRRWVEIRDEKERMLMDCMELSRDEPTRWIPKDIPNIDRRIEPLLRLEILFPELCRKFPSGLFGEHNLDFSKKLSKTLSITLSSIDDAHIQKPTEQNQVVMDALADNGVHHPLIWKKLLDRYVDKEQMFHDAGDVFTIEMCLNLVTSIYLPEDSPSESYSRTLAYASVTDYKPEILKGLLAFFSASESHNDPVDPERRLLLAIVRALAHDSAPSTFNSHQRHPFYDDSTISKYRLLRVAFYAINKDIHYHPVDLPSKQWRANVFRAILPFIMSDLFTGCSLSNWEDSELKDLLWTCRAYALAFMASLMGGGPEDCVVERNVEWATKPLFLNILRVIHDEHVECPPRLSTLPVIPDFPQHFDSIIGIVSFLLGQAFSRGIFNAYEAFEHERSLCYIADRSTLHPELIEGLRGYITGLSEAKAGKLADIQTDDLLDWHIEALHQAPVIRCICASIARSVTPPRLILSSLTSIAPHDDKWPNILQTLNSLDDEYSVQCYTLHSTDNGTSNDLKRWRKDMKEIVRILAECLEVEKGSNIDINQVCR